MVENPFLPIYHSVNGGSNTDKYSRIANGEVYLPKYIDVELTNICNFQCRFCPTGTKEMRRVKGYMSDEVAGAVVDNVRKFKIPGVRFIRWGEPTIHPKFIEIMDRIRGGDANPHKY